MGARSEDFDNFRFTAIAHILLTLFYGSSTVHTPTRDYSNILSVGAFCALMPFGMQVMLYVLHMLEFGETITRLTRAFRVANEASKLAPERLFYGHLYSAF